MLPGLKLLRRHGVQKTTSIAQPRVSGEVAQTRPASMPLQNTCRGRGQCSALPPATVSLFDQGRNFGGGSSDCSPFPRGAARRAEGFFLPKFHTREQRTARPEEKNRSNASLTQGGMKNDLTIAKGEAAGLAIFQLENRQAHQLCAHCALCGEASSSYPGDGLCEPCSCPRRS